MTKNVSVDAKSTQGKEKNINEERNKEYEEMCERVHTFKFFENFFFFSLKIEQYFSFPL